MDTSFPGFYSLCGRPVCSQSILVAQFLLNINVLFQEFALEKSLLKMKEEWTGVEFEFKPWRFDFHCIFLLPLPRKFLFSFFIVFLEIN